MWIAIDSTVAQQVDQWEVQMLWKRRWYGSDDGEKRRNFGGKGIVYVDGDSYYSVPKWLSSAMLKLAHRPAA